MLLIHEFCKKYAIVQIQKAVLLSREHAPDYHYFHHYFTVTGLHRQRLIRKDYKTRVRGSRSESGGVPTKPAEFECV